MFQSTTTFLGVLPPNAPAWLRACLIQWRFENEKSGGRVWGQGKIRGGNI